MTNDELHEILIDVWHREISADEALDLIGNDCDELHEILIDVWHREISADEALELISELA